MAVKCFSSPVNNRRIYHIMEDCAMFCDHQEKKRGGGIFNLEVKFLLYHLPWDAVETA